MARREADRITVDRAEREALGIVQLYGHADLAGHNRRDHAQIAAKVGRRLQRAGLLEIDAGARATLTDAGRQAVEAGRAEE